MKQAQDTIQALREVFAIDDEAGGSDILKYLLEFLKTETPLPDSAIEWLAQLALLYGVPFNNLVADRRMLENAVPETKNNNDPLERIKRRSTLRFFYVNWNWIDSALDGALSIGTHNSKDFKLQQAIHQAFRMEIQQAVINHRLKIRGKPLIKKVLPETMGTLTGLLFRSPIISQWPGIEIIGYKTESATDNDPEQMIDILRMDRLAPDLLILIFRELPLKIVVKEPGESVYSGFEDVNNTQTPRTYQLTLRKVSGENEIGKPLTDGGGSDKFYQLQHDTDFREGGRRVLNIDSLKNHLQTALKNAGASVTDLTPKDMAVNMINSPRYYDFTPSGTLPKTNDA